MTKIFKSIMLLALFVTLISCSKTDTITAPSEETSDKPSKSTIYQDGSDLTTSQFFFADVNGDGKEDKIWWDYTLSDGSIKVFLATGGGYFSTTHVSNYGSLLSGTKFYFSDVNGDGKADKIYWNTTISGGNIRVYLATGSGYFASTPVENSGSTLSTSKFYFADVDGDGKEDKIWWDYTLSDGSIKVFLATGNGYFSTTHVSNYGSLLSGTKFYFADVNGDGKADKIYWNTSIVSGAIRVYLATSAGSFASTPSDSNGSTNSSYSFYFADVDGDEEADKIIWVYGYEQTTMNPYARWYIPMAVYLAGSGTFDNTVDDHLITYPEQQGWPYPDPYPIVTMYFADIDGDGNDERIMWHYQYHDGDLQTNELSDL